MAEFIPWTGEADASGQGEVAVLVDVRGNESAVSGGAYVPVGVAMEWAASGFAPVSVGLFGMEADAGGFVAVSVSADGTELNLSPETAAGIAAVQLATAGEIGILTGGFMDVTVRTFGTEAEAGSISNVPVQTLAYQEIEHVNFGLTLQHPGIFRGYAGWSLVTLAETAQSDETLIDELTIRVAELASVIESNTTVLSAFASLSEFARSHDAIQVIFPALLTEYAQGNDAATAALVLVLAEYMVATDSSITVLEAVATLTEALAVLDAYDGGLFAHITEEAVLTEQLEYNLSFWVNLIEAIQVTDTPLATPIITVVMTESGNPYDILSTELDALVVMRESLFTQLAVTVNGDTYTAWAINAGTREATTYTGYDFNSFAQVNGRWYGAAKDGLYLLEGELDNGEDIPWRLRSGLTEFGKGGKLKRVPKMYLGYTSDGTVVLKILTTRSQDSDGVLQEFWYTLPARTAEQVRENRFKIGKGLKGVYWGFELAGEGPVELDVVKLFPLILSRRI